MKIAFIAAAFIAASNVHGQVKLGGGSVNVRRLWTSGVSAVVSGNKEMARALWRRCYEADPRNRDCRAGLILLGHEELIEAPDRAGYTPPKEHTMREGARANISSRTDKKSARKNWNQGLIRFQKGDARGARDAWTRCVELDPSNNDCRTGLKRLGAAPGPSDGGAKAAAEHYDAGMRLLMSGQKAKARKAFKACLAADARHRDCAKGLKRAR